MSVTDVGPTPWAIELGPMACVLVGAMDFSLVPDLCLKTVHTAAGF
jgi:hypothetical protein